MKISMRDYRNLIKETETPSKPKESKPNKKHSNDKVIDYKAICADPKWTVEEVGNLWLYTLPVPPSANAYWRSFVVNGRVRVVLSAQAKSYKEAVASLAYSLGMRPIEKGNVAISITFYRNQASGDLDNRLKVIGDALRGIAFTDDRQVVEIYARLKDDKGNGRIEISVSPRPWE